MTKEQLQQLATSLNGGQKHGSSIAFVQEINKRFSQRLGREENLLAVISSGQNAGQSSIMFKYLSGKRPITPTMEFCIKVLFEKEIEEYRIDLD